MFQYKTTALLIVVFFFTGIASFGQSSDDRAVRSPATQHLTLLGFALGKSTLADVEAKLGKSQIRRCSREEEASKEICYLSRDGKAQAVFQAGFSGGWKELDGFKIISRTLNPNCYSQCAATSLARESFRTQGGLHLGMTRKEVMDLLGEPTHSKVNKITFQWHTRQPKSEPSSTKDDYWDVQDTINVVFVNSLVVEVKVQHLVTD